MWEAWLRAQMLSRLRSRRAAAGELRGSQEFTVFSFGATKKDGKGEILKGFNGIFMDFDGF